MVRNKKEKFGKFVKQKDGEIVFQDAWGECWAEDLIDDLIKALRKQRQVRETIEYYEDLAVKHED